MHYNPQALLSHALSALMITALVACQPLPHLIETQLLAETPIGATVAAVTPTIAAAAPAGTDATPTAVPVAAGTPTMPSAARAISPAADTNGAVTWGYRIVATYPHDPAAYTQGLVYHNGYLYEGTGRQGQSTLRKVELSTGKVIQSEALADEYFGEGITIFGSRVIQLTWQSRIGFVYDLSSFDLQGSFTYSTEGWGLTHDGQRLIMSDGTARLYFLNPTTFAAVGSVPVEDQGTPIWELNELEYVEGEVFANVWLTERLARIEPQTGQVTGWIDLTGLREAQNVSDEDAVLNGIAYDPATGRLWVTGKLWPNLYQIELVPPAQTTLPLVMR